MMSMDYRKLLLKKAMIPGSLGFLGDLALQLAKFYPRPLIRSPFCSLPETMGSTVKELPTVRGDPGSRPATSLPAGSVHPLAKLNGSISK